MIKGTRVIPIALAVCVASSIGLSPAVQAKNKAVEVLKYLNPVPEKNLYLNKSQDRVIKKKGFKTLEVEGAKPVENKELGFFAIVDLNKINDTETIKSVLQKPDVNGISVLLPWRLLEPVEGETNFKPIDSLLELCKEANKTLILRVSTCGVDDNAKSDTPDWVFQDPTSRSIVYVGTDGNEHQMPIFWDPNYLAKWSNLINELGETYDKNPNIHSIGITGGGVLGGTNVIPDFVASVKQTIGAEIKAKPEKGKEGTTDSSAPADGFAEKPADATSEKPANQAENSDDKTAAASTDSATEVTTEKADAGKTEGDKPATTDASKTASNDSASKSTDSDDDDKGAGKEAKREVTRILEKQFGMTQRQLIEHWKYVADLFPKAFTVTRLNFDVSPPTLNRKGQDSLDEIADYLVYRYGQRIYVTRHGVKDGHHGFDDYRLLLKFHPDTLTGYRMTNDFAVKDMPKLVKAAGEDGISFCEIPIDVINNADETTKTAMHDIRQRMGYQIVSKEVSLPKDLKAGDPLKASFTFLNLGAASALKPSRQLDKDIASSYKVQLELRDTNGKPIARLLHTPETPTNAWSSGKPIQWAEELKTPAQLTPGKYEVYLSLVDSDTKRKLRFLNGIGTGEPQALFEAPVGSIQVTN
ncbi:DUF4832 domain-containing protein [Candidatus Obscuribacterales bacterium]|nr:DUF4832 domain-containing protein [Candidatus Obscuribacterales bacterium]